MQSREMRFGSMAKWPALELIATQTDLSVVRGKQSVLELDTSSTVKLTRARVLCGIKSSKMLVQRVGIEPVTLEETGIGACEPMGDHTRRPQLLF